MDPLIIALIVAVFTLIVFYALFLGLKFDSLGRKIKSKQKRYAAEIKLKVRNFDH